MSPPCSEKTSQSPVDEQTLIASLPRPATRSALAILGAPQKGQWVKEPSEGSQAWHQRGPSKREEPGVA